jgi:hypothetical protein
MAFYAATEAIIHYAGAGLFPYRLPTQVDGLLITRV